jgi:hypothetical protein
LADDEELKELFEGRLRAVQDEINKVRDEQLRLKEEQARAKEEKREQDRLQRQELKEQQRLEQKTIKEQQLGSTPSKAKGSEGKATDVEMVEEAKEDESGEKHQAVQPQLQKKAPAFNLNKFFKPLQPEEKERMLL